MHGLRRLTPLTGLAGIALLVAGLATDSAPTAKWPDARIEQWYTQHGRGPWLLSAYLLAGAAALLLVFTADVHQRVADSGAGHRAQSLVLGSGVAFAVTVLTGAGLYAAVPAAMTFTHAPAPSADTSRYLLGAAYGILVMFSAFAAAVFAASISVTALRHRVVPKWLAIAGIPASALMLANAALPMGVITLWFVAASISLAVRRTSRAVAATPPAPVAAHTSTTPSYTTSSSG